MNSPGKLNKKDLLIVRAVYITLFVWVVAWFSFVGWIMVLALKGPLGF
jgi:hypothetical protein